MSSSSITKTPGPALARWIGTITLAALVWVADEPAISRCTTMMKHKTWC